MANEDDKKAVEAKKEGAMFTDYLVSPKKKKRQYVLLLLGEQFDLELRREIIRFVRERYPRLVIAEPGDQVEFQRQFARKIQLLIVDDEFADRDQIMQLIYDLKLRKHEEAVPVLFLTRQPDELLKAYHEHLLDYHEVDEFCPYLKMSRAQVLSRVKVGVEQANRRRSRRYVVDIPISFYHLGKDKRFTALITDLSAHGARIDADDSSFLFKAGDQLRISLPVREFFTPKDGDFLKISAKVRRVFMSGNAAGISFEHVTESQFLGLANILSVLIDRMQNNRRSSNT